VAVQDGEIRTQEGHGRFVERQANTTVNKALSTWKELTSPRPVERSGIPATGV
jgi:dihydropyrimidinase